MADGTIRLRICSGSQINLAHEIVVDVTHSLWKGEKRLTNLVLKGRWLEEAGLGAGTRVEVIVGSGWVLTIANGAALAEIQRQRGFPRSKT